MLGIIELSSGFWALYGDAVLTCIMWGVIGYMITLPLSLILAVYNAARVGNTYDLYGDYRLEKSRYKREAKLYGAANASVVLLLLTLLRG